MKGKKKRQQTVRAGRPHRDSRTNDRQRTEDAQEQGPRPDPVRRVEGGGFAAQRCEAEEEDKRRKRELAQRKKHGF
jgi:hypothetical protein